MRAIEVFLASFIIVIAISFASFMASVPVTQKYESTELVKIGYNALHDLDEMGLLARYIYNEEWTNLTMALRVILPNNVHFNLKVYYLNGSRVSHPPILYGNQEIFENSNYVSSVTYAVVGYPTKINATYYLVVYDPRIIVLQLTGW